MNKLHKQAQDRELEKKKENEWVSVKHEIKKMRERKHKKKKFYGRS